MQPAIALLALFVVACAGHDSSPGPTGPTGPPDTPVAVDGGLLFTHGNAVALLPAGIAEYRAAIVFLPGLRDPATGKPLDSRALVSGSSGVTCSIWCSSDKAEVWSRSLELAGGERC